MSSALVVPTVAFSKVALSAACLICAIGACGGRQDLINPKYAVESEVVTRYVQSSESGNLAIILVGGSAALSRCSDFAFFVRRMYQRLPPHTSVALLTDDMRFAKRQFGARGLAIAILKDTIDYPSDYVVVIALEPAPYRILSTYSVKSIDARTDPGLVARELLAWADSVQELAR